MYKILHVFNLHNKRDDLILKIDASNDHWSAVLKIKEGKKLCKHYSESFNKPECNYPSMEKEIITVITVFEKFLIFLTPKTFLIQTNFKGILGFVKKNLSNIQFQG